MVSPKIKIDGKTYSARPPRVKLWRMIVEFNKEFGAIDDFHANIDAYNSMLNLLAECYGIPAVTPDTIENNLELSELIPTFTEVTGWVGELVSGSTKALPGKN